MVGTLRTEPKWRGSLVQLIESGSPFGIESQGDLVFSITEKWLSPTLSEPAC